MGDLSVFREETRAWLIENCPEGAKGPGVVHSGSTKVRLNRTLSYGWNEWPNGGGRFQRGQRNTAVVV